MDQNERRETIADFLTLYADLHGLNCYEAADNLIAALGLNGRLTVDLMELADNLDTANPTPRYRIETIQ